MKKLLFLIALSIQTSWASQGTLTQEQRLYGLSLLWMEASYNFAYFDQVPGLDWDATYKNYIPKVLAAESDFQYYRLLSRFMAELSDGMTYVEMDPRLIDENIAFPPVKLAEAQHQAVVVGVAKELADQLPLGAVITKVDGRDVKSVLMEQVFPYVSSSTESIRWFEAIKGNRRLGYGLLAGNDGSRVELEFMTPTGSVEKVQLQRKRDLSNVEWTLANGVIDKRQPVSYKALANNIGYVALNDFSSEQVSDAFLKLVPKLQKSAGLILDLRHNTGGNTFVAEDILKHLTFRDLEGTRTKMRIHNSTYKAWGKYSAQFSWAKKYEPYFKGTAWQVNEPDKIFADEIADIEKVVIPTVILISRETSAAAESFLVYASSAKHITLIGEPTFGSTGQPLDIELPGGGHAKICTKRETFADGRDFVGVGIQPDLFVERDIDFYLADHDKALSSATAWLNEQVNKASYVAAAFGGKK